MGSRLHFLILVSPLLLLPCLSFAEKSRVLTAENVKNLSLENNLNVQIASTDQEIGKQDLPAAKSIYDTTLRARASYLDDQSKRVTTVFGTRSTTTIYDIELLQKTPLGTELSAGFLNQRDSTNSIFATVNPAYESEMEFTLRQPVAKNAFGFVDRKQIQLVKKRIEALDYSTRSQIEGSVYQSLVDYWTFYFHHHNVSFERETVVKARELYVANQRKKDIGLIEKSDLYAFAANFDVRENSWLQAKDAVSEARERIRQDLSLPPSEILKPGRENLSPKKTHFIFQEVLMNALAHRPDYLALKKNLEASHLDVALKKNSRWPQIDVLASLNLNGIDSDYGGALDDIGGGHPAWQVGMEFSFPFRNRFQRSEHKKSTLQRARKILELKDKEQEIVRQVAKTLKKLKTVRSRLNATYRAKKNQFQKLRGEITKYEQGRSDSDTLIRFQNDYIEAKQLSLKAQYDYQIALLDLEFIQGAILD